MAEQMTSEQMTSGAEQMTSGVVCGQVGTNYPRGL